MFPVVQNLKMCFRSLDKKQIGNLPYAAAFDAARQVMTCEEGRKSETVKKAISNMVKRGVLGQQDSWLWVC
jgi:hypothetical protein